MLLIECLYSYIIEYTQSMNRDKRFIVELQEDVASGELIATIPQQILNEMDWYEGTQLEWVMEGDEIILRESN